MKCVGMIRTYTNTSTNNNNTNTNCTTTATIDGMSRYDEEE